MPKALPMDWKKIDPIIHELWNDRGYLETHAAIKERAGIDLTEWRLRHRATKHGLKISQAANNAARIKTSLQRRSIKQVMVDAAITDHYRSGGWIAVHEITGCKRAYILRRANNLHITMTESTAKMIHDIDVQARAKAKLQAANARKQETWPVISDLEKLALCGRRA